MKVAVFDFDKTLFITDAEYYHSDTLPTANINKMFPFRESLSVIFEKWVKEDNNLLFILTLNPNHKSIVHLTNLAYPNLFHSIIFADSKQSKGDHLAFLQKTYSPSLITYFDDNKSVLESIPNNNGLEKVLVLNNKVNLLNLVNKHLL